PHHLPLSLFTTPPPTHIYTLSLHDALPICAYPCRSTILLSHNSQSSRERDASYWSAISRNMSGSGEGDTSARCSEIRVAISVNRSEEHTSELQSRGHLVCRLLLEKKKRKVK